MDAVGRSVVRELVEEKTPKVLQGLPNGGEGWTTYHALFARAGFTDAGWAEAQAHEATLVCLAALDRDLHAAG